MLTPYSPGLVETYEEQLLARNAAIAEAQAALGARYDVIQAIAYEAWGPRRDAGVKEAVLAELHKHPLTEDQLKVLLNAEEQTLRMVSVALPYHGSLACGGPNSALDVPRGIVQAINAILGQSG